MGEPEENDGAEPVDNTLPIAADEEQAPGKLSAAEIAKLADELQAEGDPDLKAGLTPADEPAGDVDATDRGAGNKLSPEEIAKLVAELAAEGEPDVKAGVTRAKGKDDEDSLRDAVTGPVPQHAQVDLPTLKVEVKARASSAAPTSAGDEDGVTEPYTQLPSTISAEDPTWVPIHADDPAGEAPKDRKRVAVTAVIAAALAFGLYLAATRTNVAADTSAAAASTQTDDSAASSAGSTASATAPAVASVPDKPASPLSSAPAPSEAPSPAPAASPQSAAKPTPASNPRPFPTPKAPPRPKPSAPPPAAKPTASSILIF